MLVSLCGITEMEGAASTAESPLAWCSHSAARRVSSRRCLYRAVVNATFLPKRAFLGFRPGSSRRTPAAAALL